MSPSGIIAVLLVSPGRRRWLAGRTGWGARRPPSLCAFLFLGDDLRPEVASQQLGVRLRRLLQVAVLPARGRIPLVVGAGGRRSLTGGPDLLPGLIAHLQVRPSRHGGC